MAKQHDYHRMNAIEKERYHRARDVCEPAVTCPICEVQTTPTDLLRHVDTRCEGPGVPHRAARWITTQEAEAMGVNRDALYRWTRRGRVRFIGERVAERRFLLRDLVRIVALQRAESKKENGR